MISAVASVLLLVPNVEEEEAVDSARDSFNFRLKESKARPARDCKGGAISAHRSRGSSRL